MDETARYYRKKIGRTIRIFFPFLLLALIVVSIFVTRLWLGYEPVTEITPTISSITGELVVDEQPIPDSTIMLATPATLNATIRNPQSTLTSLATLPPDATIRLSGPPPGSSFYLNDPINIYWSWPIELSDDQQFAIYLLIDQEKHLAGVIQEPALGNHGYQLSFDPGNIVHEEGTYQIQVHLESKGAPAILAKSTPRAVSLMRLPES